MIPEDERWVLLIVVQAMDLQVGVVGGGSCGILFRDVNDWAHGFSLCWGGSRSGLLERWSGIHSGNGGSRTSVRIILGRTINGVFLFFQKGLNILNITSDGGRVVPWQAEELLTLPLEKSKEIDVHITHTFTVQNNLRVLLHVVSNVIQVLEELLLNVLAAQVVLRILADRLQLSLDHTLFELVELAEAVRFERRKNQLPGRVDAKFWYKYSTNSY